MARQGRRYEEEELQRAIALSLQAGAGGRQHTQQEPMLDQAQLERKLSTPQGQQEVLDYFLATDHETACQRLQSYFAQNKTDALITLTHWARVRNTPLLNKLRDLLEAIASSEVLPTIHGNHRASPALADSQARGLVAFALLTEWNGISNLIKAARRGTLYSYMQLHSWGPEVWRGFLNVVREHNDTLGAFKLFIIKQGDENLINAFNAADIVEPMGHSYVVNASQGLAAGLRADIQDAERELGQVVGDRVDAITELDMLRKKLDRVTRINNIYKELLQGEVQAAAQVEANSDDSLRNAPLSREEQARRRLARLESQNTPVAVDIDAQPASGDGSAHQGDAQVAGWPYLLAAASIGAAIFGIASAAALIYFSLPLSFALLVAMLGGGIGCLLETQEPFIQRYWAKEAGKQSKLGGEAEAQLSDTSNLQSPDNSANTAGQPPQTESKEELRRKRLQALAKQESGNGVSPSTP